jgi:poly-gamma-glutamate synthase PgsB/CapB
VNENTSANDKTLWGLVAMQLQPWEQMAFERHINDLYQSFGDQALSIHHDQRQAAYEFLARCPTLLVHLFEQYESRRFSYESFSLIVRPTPEQVIACARRLAGTSVDDESVTITSREALRDYYRSEQGYLQQRLWLALRLLEVICGLIAKGEELSSLKNLVIHRSLREAQERLFGWSGDQRILVVLVRSLVATQNVVGCSQFSSSWVNSLQRSREWARSRAVDIWVRTQALKLLWRNESGEIKDALVEILLTGVVSDRGHISNFVMTELSNWSDHRVSECVEAEAEDVFLKAAIFEILQDEQDAGSIDSVLLFCSSACSPYVRQAAARYCAGKLKSASNEPKYLEHLSAFVLRDSHPSVQALSLQLLSELAVSEGCHEDYLSVMLQLLSGELKIESMPQLLIKTMFHSLRCFLYSVVGANIDLLNSGVYGDLQRCLTELLESYSIKDVELLSTFYPVQLPEWCLRELEATIDVFWLLKGKGRLLLLRELEELCRNTKIGDSFRISSAMVTNKGMVELFRVLKMIASDDVGFDVSLGALGLVVRRGFQMRRQWWRIRHEFLTPSPDKRQAYAHTKARYVRGRWRIPSHACAEVTMARVPGEPVLFRDEGSWRGSLPLLSDVLCAARRAMRGKAEPQVQIHSGFTVTDISVKGGRAGLSCWWGLSRDFASVALLRLRKRSGNEPFSDYLEALSKYGVTVAVRPVFAEDSNGSALNGKAQNSSASAHVAGVSLPAILPFGFGDWLSSQLAKSSELPLQLTAVHLTLFIILMVGFFTAAYVWECKRTQKIRAGIPIVIGGWGSRGKSGTERLKAALFSGLGLSVVSKSTGCEAMMVVGEPFTDPHEIPLYRTYDKATIWEQRDVLQFADSFKPEVFLWECMALTPAYVRVLQHGWMQDDFSTVTNTYPDHEDIQGPSGIDVAKTICEFIPENSTVISSEEQMVPFLHEAASERRSAFHRTGWFEAGILTEDVLERFPYLEHPYNIGLVLGLSDQLGIERSVALREMADRVIADLGVLKTTAVAKVSGRTLEFTNGMSANERTGCLNNWYATGFASQDIQEDPGTFLVTVVNNRADRPARSRVFGQIVTNDLSADLHVLIGTNLTGLYGILQEEWAVYCESIKLELDDANPHSVRESVLAEARKLRLFSESSSLIARVKCMIRQLDTSGEFSREVDDLTAIEPFSTKLNTLVTDTKWGSWVKEIVAYLAAGELRIKQLEDILGLASNVDAGSLADFRARVIDWFTTLFFEKIVVVEDREASGEEIIQNVVDGVPVGMNARVMGIQNIKGAGMDFVLQWYRWDAFAQLCKSLERQIAQGAATQMVERGLQSIIDIGGFNLLMKERLVSLIATVRSSTYGEQAGVDQKAKWIEAVLSGAEPDASSGSNEKSGSRKAKWVFSLLGKVLESNRGIYRKLSARRTYAKLLQNKISYEESRSHLWKLYKEQENGWMG